MINIIKLLFSKFKIYIYIIIVISLTTSFYLYRASLIEKGRSIEKSIAQQVHDKILKDSLAERDKIHESRLETQKQNYEKRILLNDTIDENNKVVEKAQSQSDSSDTCFNNDWMLHANSILANTFEPLF